MAVIYTPHFVQFFDDTGTPLAGGKLYTYAAGTSTPKATYTDASGSTPNANPVVLDAAGRATVFLTGSYKFTLKTSGDVLVKETDNVTAFTSSGSSVDSIPTSFTEDVITASDSVIFSDASDSGNTKRDTVQGILDLVPTSTSGEIYLGSATASASATLDLTSYITSTYNQYKIVLEDIKPATGAGQLRLRVSSNNGSSWDSGATDYVQGYDISSGSAGSNPANAAYFSLYNASMPTTDVLCGEIWLWNPNSTTGKKMITSNVVGYDSGGPWYMGQDSKGCRNTTSAINAVQVFNSAGNITSGTIRIYGVKKS